ncbi:MAG: hypothetical protein CME06_03640 [Gemmatimonadetes bacterium]|nr:hypothetical protein [Gemmatimonadota bacterium]
MKFTAKFQTVCSAALLTVASLILTAPASAVDWAALEGDFDFDSVDWVEVGEDNVLAIEIQGSWQGACERANQVVYTGGRKDITGSVTNTGECPLQIIGRKGRTVVFDTGALAPGATILVGGCVDSVKVNCGDQGLQCSFRYNISIGPCQ